MYFSIVIITLNESNYVFKLLDDLKKQTYNKFEVIVVDGNSDDNTISIVKEYTDDLSLEVIESKQRGPGLQRNIGARNSKYENLIFLDADTSIPSNFLKDICTTLKQNKFEYLTVWWKPIEKGFLYKLLTSVYNLYISCVQKHQGISAGAFIFTKKYVFNKIGGFPENINFGEDRKFTHAAFKNGYKFKVLKKPKVGISFRRYKKYGFIKMLLISLKFELDNMLGKSSIVKNYKKYKFGEFD